MSKTEASDRVWYEANCHCGAIKYKVNTPSLETQKVTNCNCSICCKNGYLNVYPKRTDVVFHCGEDHIKGYLFGEKKCVHKFCPTCGSSLFVDPHMDDPELMVVNVCVSFLVVVLWAMLIGPRYGCSRIWTWISWTCGSMMGSTDYNLDMKYDWLARRWGKLQQCLGNLDSSRMSYNLRRLLETYSKANQPTDCALWTTRRHGSLEPNFQTLQQQLHKYSAGPLRNPLCTGPRTTARLFDLRPSRYYPWWYESGERLSEYKVSTP